MKNAFFFDSPIGKIGIASESESITNVFFGNSVHPDTYIVSPTPLLLRAREELEEYFQGERYEFDLPLRPKGTTFELSVWAALCKIPYGSICSYKEIAVSIQAPKAYRAVGRANSRNPISILIPCHRVIGASGKLVGYAGGLENKSFLLELEGILAK